MCVQRLLTLTVLLSEVGLLPLQFSLSPSLFSLNLLSQTLHVALLLLHTLPSSRLLTRGETGTQLPLELHFFDTLRQTHRSRIKYRLKNFDGKKP